MVVRKYELEIMWKKVILAFLKFLSQSFPGGTEVKIRNDTPDPQTRRTNLSSTI
jgi:hypothetical protein